MVCKLQELANSPKLKQPYCDQKRVNKVILMILITIITEIYRVQCVTLSCIHNCSDIVFNTFIFRLMEEVRVSAYLRGWTYPKNKNILKQITIQTICNFYYYTLLFYGQVHIAFISAQLWLMLNRHFYSIIAVLFLFMLRVKTSFKLQYNPS